MPHSTIRKLTLLDRIFIVRLKGTFALYCLLSATNVTIHSSDSWCQPLSLPEDLHHTLMRLEAGQISQILLAYQTQLVP